MSKGQSLDELRKKTQEDCVHQSLVAGGKAAAWALATAGTVVFLANQYLPTFRTSLGVSGKTALIVSLPCSPSSAHREYYVSTCLGIKNYNAILVK